MFNFIVSFVQFSRYMITILALCHEASTCLNPKHDKSDMNYISALRFLTFILYRVITILYEYPFSTQLSKLTQRK